MQQKNTYLRKIKGGNMAYIGVLTVNLRNFRVCEVVYIKLFLVSDIVCLLTDNSFAIQL